MTKPALLILTEKNTRVEAMYCPVTRSTMFKFINADGEDVKLALSREALLAVFQIVSTPLLYAPPKDLLQRVAAGEGNEKDKAEDDGPRTFKVDGKLFEDDDEGGGGR